MKVIQGEVFQFVAIVVAEECSTDKRSILAEEIQFESAFVSDFGADSIQLQMIVGEVERRFEVDLDYAMVNRLTTIRSLVDLVMSEIAVKQPTLV